eukprot:EG_transcript_11639
MPLPGHPLWTFMGSVDWVRWLPKILRWKPVLSATLSLQTLCGRQKLTGRCDYIDHQHYSGPSPWIALAILGPPADINICVGGVDPARSRLPSTELQNHLKLYTIDVERLVQRYQRIVFYDVERVERVTSYLAGLGVDVRQAVERFPILLGGRVEKYEAVVQLLRDEGIDVVRVVNRIPSILTRRVVTLQRTMDAISGSGCSVADVSYRHPPIFRCSATNLSSTLEILSTRLDQTCQQRTAAILPDHKDSRGMLLSSLGLNAEWLLRKAPRVAAVGFDKIREVVDLLERLGVDAPKVVRSAPAVLTLHLQSLQQRLLFLSDNGLDVVRQVNGCPTILCFSIERKLQPTLAFVVHDMGRSASDLNGAYNIWTCSLKGRLQPRFLYLKSLGRSPASLSQFGSLSDERFAASIAGTDRQHYYAWREQNGFLVPPGHPQPAAAVPGVAATDSALIVSPIVDNHRTCDPD